MGASTTEMLMLLDLGPVSIRPFARPDLPRLAVLANDERVWRTLRDIFPHPYTLADAESWYEHVGQLDPCHQYAISSPTEGLVGGIGLTELPDPVHSHVREIGYWLAYPYWGRGWMSLVVGALTEWALVQPDIERVEAQVFHNNPASARVLEKAGYVREGILRGRAIKSGAALDEWMYARVR